MLPDTDISKPKRAWVVRWKRRLRQFWQRTVRVFNLTVGTLAMVAVFFLAAFLAMRVGIHGREVNVPSFAGLEHADAARLADSLGLNLEVENRFYSSAVGANHVLSQSPAQGNRVRRGWQVRVTESLGPQEVAVPNVVGQAERDASVSLRRVGLDVATVAYLPGLAAPGVVLAQSPPPDSTSAQGPGVSLLVSGDPLPSTSYAYVMPSLIGLTVAGAEARLGMSGLRLGSVQDVDADGSVEASPGGAAAGGRAVITSQSPLPGHRVTRGDTVRVVVTHSGGTGEKQIPPE